MEIKTKFNTSDYVYYYDFFSNTIYSSFIFSIKIICDLDSGFYIYYRLSRCDRYFSEKEIFLTKEELTQSLKKNIERLQKQ